MLYLTRHLTQATNYVKYDIPLEMYFLNNAKKYTKYNISMTYSTLMKNGNRLRKELEVKRVAQFQPNAFWPFYKNPSPKSKKLKNPR